MPNLFGTDGIRGRSNKEMTPELAYKGRIDKEKQATGWSGTRYENI